MSTKFEAAGFHSPFHQSIVNHGMSSAYVRACVHACVSVRMVPVGQVSIHKQYEVIFMVAMERCGLNVGCALCMCI